MEFVNITLHKIMYLKYIFAAKHLTRTGMLMLEEIHRQRLTSFCMSYC